MTPYRFRDFAYTRTEFHTLEDSATLRLWGPYPGVRTCPSRELPGKTLAPPFDRFVRSIHRIRVLAAGEDIENPRTRLNNEPEI
jgi:hypothetical protein